jgi:hypothetical protein
MKNEDEKTFFLFKSYVSGRISPIEKIYFLGSYLNKKTQIAK